MDRPPLRLLGLEIQNFRGISERSFDFCDGFGEPLSTLVFAGPNGAGKTTVLHAILLLLGAREMLPADLPPFAQQVRFGAADFRLALRTRRGATNNEALIANSVVLSSFPPPPDHPFRATSYHQNDTWRFTRAVGLVDATINYHSARRHPDSPASAVSDAKPVGGAHDVADLQRALVSVYYRGLRARTPLGESSPFERLARYWRDFADDDRVLDVLPTSNDPSSGDSVVLRAPGPLPDDVTSLAQARALAPGRADIPAMVPLDHLSAGQISVLTLAGSLLFRDRPLDVMVIDEPEQHLHPRWHHQLLPALRALSPDTLFVVATHSEAILRSVASYECFLLDELDESEAARGAAAE